jgi:site-specific DNA recombinase
MKYLIYTRVSPRGSDWSGDTSCEAQAAECRARILAVDNKATFSAVSDELMTGTNNRRPALQAALQAAKDGSAEWDALVSLDIDRVARSIEGMFEIVRLLQKAGKGIMFVRQNLDLATASGRFMLAILASVSEYFAALGSEKTLDKMNFIARKGEWPAGRVPFGFKRKEARDNLLLIDEPKAAIVRSIFADSIAGHGDVWISRKYKMPRNTINKMLANPIYYGRIRYGEIDAQGKHAPIVSESTWIKAQSGISKMPTPRPDRQLYPYLLTGLVKCECGMAMSPATCKGTGGKYPYYRCTNPECKAAGRYVRADKLEAAILNAVTDYSCSPQRLKDLADSEAKKHSYRYSQSAPEIDRHQIALNRLQKDIDRLTASLTVSTSSGFTGASQAILQALDKKQSEAGVIKDEIGALKARISTSDIARDAKAFAKGLAVWARSISATGDAQTKRAWVQAHINSAVWNGKEFQCQYRVDMPSSRNSPEWHPEAALIELSIAL